MMTFNETHMTATQYNLDQYASTFIKTYIRCAINVITLLNPSIFTLNLAIHTTLSLYEVGQAIYKNDGSLESDLHSHSAKFEILQNALSVGCISLALNAVSPQLQFISLLLSGIATEAATNAAKYMTQDAVVSNYKMSHST